jgi:predicted PurR-regulated permease PerM
VKLGVSLFSNVLSILTVLVITFYLLLSRNEIEGTLVNVLDEKRSQRILAFFAKLETRLGGWARGQIILMFIVGVANYLVFLILGIPFALPLSILAGLLELVPVLGPFFAAIPAVIVGLGISPLTGILVASMALLIQQLENYLLVPKVMQRSVGVSPVVTLIALIIGFKVAGVAGAILCMPIVVSLQVAAKEYFG